MMQDRIASGEAVEVNESLDRLEELARIWRLWSRVTSRIRLAAVCSSLELVTRAGLAAGREVLCERERRSRV